MTLGDIIKEYRAEHGISMREFSNMSGISKGYLSMLEKNEHPTTGKKIAPSLDMIKQVADTMGVKVNDIISMLEKGQPITLTPALHGRDLEMINLFHQLNDTGKIKLMERARELIELGYQKGETDAMAQ